MIPPVFPTAFASAAVKAALGTSPCRVYPFGEAPEGVTLPYAAWQIITGSPENYLSNTPDTDSYTVQVDVYGATSASVLAAAKTLRDAFEPVAHIVRWGGTGRDPVTRNFSFSFDVDWIDYRAD